MITARRILYLIFILLLVESCAPKSFVSSTNSIHLALGNPTQANASSPDNYLIIKPQYTLSYNRTKGHANWVAWELSRNWLGSSDRQNDFRPDDNLPQNWVKISPNDYSSTGFDRGHLCPSADRTNSPTNNSTTFLMTNIIPQAPELNRESWAYLEEFCRDLALQKYKLYITAGTYGTGGEGSKGSARKINDKVNVPARIYKIIVVLPENSTINDLSADTPVIAVDFPNKSNALHNAGWFRFVTTVAEIEEKTGTRFFSSTTSSVRNSLINKRFDYRNFSIDIDTKCSVYKGNTLFVGRSGGCYYFNAKGNKTYVERNLCDCK